MLPYQSRLVRQHPFCHSNVMMTSFTLFPYACPYCAEAMSRSMSSLAIAVSSSFVTALLMSISI